MTKFKIIHWDDDEEDSTDISIILKRVFGKENIDYEFTDLSIDILIKRLITDSEQFGLLILDILDKNKKPIGTKLLKQLLPEHKVIVLTENADAKMQMELNDPVIQVQFQKLYKSDTISDPYKYFIPEIERLTPLKRLRSISIELTWDKNDINTNYQISLITEDHLSILISEYLNNKKDQYKNIQRRVRVNPLVSGYSGALVFHVEFFFDSAGSVSILLKADKIKSSIEKELQSATGQHYNQIHQDYRVEYDERILKSETQSSCWYALTASFIENGETLKHRFLRSNEFNVELLITLFKKCLVPVYSKNVKRFQKSDIFYPVQDLLNILFIKKKAYILNTVKELSLLSKEINDKQISEIFNFATTIQEKALKSEETETYQKVVLVHGDLHGNNIMLSVNNQLKIIDPANMDYSHWSRDLCMLIVDLFAYGIHNEDKNYFGIQKIKKWRILGKCLFSGTILNNDSKNEVLCQALSILSNHQIIKEKLGFKPWFELWEFQLSLVLEFLRISYKSNQLPPGKRAACMLIAIDGFKLAKITYSIYLKEKIK